jgi:hypothetical protein
MENIYKIDPKLIRDEDNIVIGNIHFILTNKTKIIR